MSNTRAEPWRELSPAVADALEPELPVLTREIMHAIAHEVPEYVRPLEGAFGAAVQTGVEEALRRFVGLIREPQASGDAGRQVYVALGWREHREGRTLDALQAAYRVGARVSWRRLARVSQTVGLDESEVALLAEAIFAYIDGLSADSIEGYAQAQSERAGERAHRREALVVALLRGSGGGELAPLAAAAGWRLPASAAAVACSVESLASLTRRVGPDALAAPFEDAGCVVIPDADGPGRLSALRVAAANQRVAVGPSVPITRLPTSWRLARASFELDVADGFVVADDHLSSLLVQEAAPVVERIAARRLAPLAELTPKARTRMIETALAYLQHQGNAAATARALHLHPQSARYRIARLRELLGDDLLDADARFELEAALRTVSP